MRQRGCTKRDGRRGRGLGGTRELVVENATAHDSGENQNARGVRRIVAHGGANLSAMFGDVKVAHRNALLE
jgi:hypothetical protein